MRRKHEFCHRLQPLLRCLVIGSNGCQALHIAQVPELCTIGDIVAYPVHKGYWFKGLAGSEEDYFPGR